ncbi:hypothetical protein OV079_48085 [Nannocystis pusilla]|uniref:Uncharacterized protein n=1 Tax=Nannocystis pusilla TaxID=889268 RepID=A0A9X3J3E5_9BACT|nr:hypothetical protein [Nannocystis pusilla]MCY1013165.1 hypothetical protein [Nannocystis pusilla]
MGSLHIGVVAALWAGAVEPALAAPASPRPVVEFRWDAPASCPVEAEVVAELERLLGGPLAERKGPRLTAIARVRQEPGGGFDLRLWTVSDEGTLQRSLTHAQCDALARAGALIAAMAIDPSVLERMSEETDAAEVAAEAKTVEDPEPLPEPEPPEPEPELAPPEPVQPEPPRPPLEKKKERRARRRASRCRPELRRPAGRRGAAEAHAGADLAARAARVRGRLRAAATSALR